MEFVRGFIFILHFCQRNQLLLRKGQTPQLKKTRVLLILLHNIYSPKPRKYILIQIHVSFVLFPPSTYILSLSCRTKGTLCSRPIQNSKNSCVHLQSLSIG